MTHATRICRQITKESTNQLILLILSIYPLILLLFLLHCFFYSFFLVLHSFLPSRSIISLNSSPCYWYSQYFSLTNGAPHHSGFSFQIVAISLHSSFLPREFIECFPGGVSWPFNPLDTIHCCYCYCYYYCFFFFFSYYYYYSDTYNF